MQFSSQDLLCIYPLHAEVVLLSHSRIKLVDATLTSAESCLPHCDSVLLSGCELENKKSLLFFSFAARAAALAVCQRAECVPKKTRPRGSCRCHRGCQADRPRAPSICQQTGCTVERRSNVTGASRLCFPGNGPSGICLSYLLSGHTPYFSPDASHPNPLLHGKLGEQPHLSLLQQVRDAQSE